jgi:hypothetical protein
MTLVKFITKDIMLSNTNLYENRMFTNKMKCNMVWGGKGRDKVRLIKSLINTRVKIVALRVHYY